MNALEGLIRQEIAARGPMRFDRFMALALYHPENGYYARPRLLGRSGDFFTSVSVGPLFGRLLARQFRQMAELLDEEEFWIVEQGAHSGELARDILEAWRTLPETSVRLRYLIVEPIPVVRDLQARLLLPFEGQVQWRDNIEAWMEKKPVGVYFSNELVDALPVRLVEFAREWRERCVIQDEAGALAWGSEPVEHEELAEALREQALPRVENYRTEIHLEARRWMRGVAGFLRRGYVLTIDYGYPASLYYAPFRGEGTLTSYRQHRRGDDVLVDPGERDITAHVDFSALAREGRRAGWETLALVDQARFLTGIVEREREAVGAKEVRAFQTLTHPEHLGARFKALVQAKDAPPGLSGLRFAQAGQLD